MKLLSKPTITISIISLFAFTAGGCTHVGPVNLTERTEIDFSEVARFRVCNLGAAVDSVDGKRLLFHSKNLINNVVYVEPGNHQVVVSGTFPSKRRFATIDLLAVAGKVYTFHYRYEGTEIYAYYKERPRDYPTSCDTQRNSADD